MDALFTTPGLIALVTLTFLEIVLGVDNVIFISILSGNLPRHQQGRARRIGLLVAMGTRILLLLSIVWIIRLTAPLFVVFGKPISGRDLILIGGGLFRECDRPLPVSLRRSPFWISFFPSTQ